MNLLSSRSLLGKVTDNEPPATENVIVNSHGKGGVFFNASSKMIQEEKRIEQILCRH